MFEGFSEFEKALKERRITEGCMISVYDDPSGLDETHYTVELRDGEITLHHAPVGDIQTGEKYLGSGHLPEKVIKNNYWKKKY